MVFCCSEILGQLDVFQDSSVVGPESLLPSWTGSVCVPVCASVSVHFWSCTCGHMLAHACVPVYMSMCIYVCVYTCVSTYPCVFAKTWALSLQLPVLDNTRLH